MRATPKSSSYIQLLGTSSPAAILLQSLDAASPPDRTAGTGTKWKKMAQSKSRKKQILRCTPTETNEFLR